MGAENQSLKNVPQMHKKDLFFATNNNNNNNKKKERKKKAVAVIFPASATSTEAFRGNMIYLNRPPPPIT